MPDDLLAPTISRGPDVGARPWRVQSLLVPAILGGPVAVAALGVVNAGRLGLAPLHRLVIAAAGLAGLAAFALAAAALGRGTLRAGTAVTGALVWLAVSWLQRRPFRAFSLRGGEPAPLWVPGLVAVVVAIAVEGAVGYASLRVAA